MGFSSQQVWCGNLTPKSQQKLHIVGPPSLRTMNHIFSSGLIVLFALSSVGCSRLQNPNQLTWNPGESPDYKLADAWISLPNRMDPSDEVPKGLPDSLNFDKQSELEVDVFFVHPTMYFKGDHWNGDLDDQKLNKANEETPVRLQASAFNIGGKLYAPRYRQAHIGVFTWQDDTSWRALELAYDDVRSAFIHYLENWNDGRGIILAGHSQGSWHVRWLLQEFFDGKPLQNQLVVAYAPGFDFYESDFEELPYCKSANQTGCVCSWMSYGEGYFPAWLEHNGQTPMCVHPVTWQTHGANDFQSHSGVVLSQMRFAHPQSIEAHIERGVLQIHEPNVPFGKVLQRQNWHIGDINLFWSNIRTNARLRAVEFRPNSSNSN